jgi:protein-S-isoprenylcysteine O-methyltransferase Ste14
MSDPDSAIQPNGTSGVRIFPPAIYLGGLVIGYLVQWLIPIPIGPASWNVWIRIIGAVVFVLGLWSILSAGRIFQRIGTPPNPREATTALAVEGPYRYSRNPMYLGMAMVLAGLALLGNALWPLLAVIPSVWFIQTRVIAREEPYLETKFGDDYRAFKGRVRRWL